LNEERRGASPKVLLFGTRATSMSESAGAAARRALAEIAKRRGRGGVVGNMEGLAVVALDLRSALGVNNDRGKNMVIRLLLGLALGAAGCGGVTLERSEGDGGDARVFEDATTSDASAADAPVTDPRACRTSVECSSGARCVDGLCTRAEPGRACATADECASGFCVDGVCCNAACGGGCLACNLPGRAGVCWPVAAGEKDPRGACADEGVATCGTTGTCDGFGRCAQYQAGAICAASSCSGNAFVAARVCDGRGTCGPPTSPRACAPYACHPAACLDACITDAGCAAPGVCLGGACKVPPAIVFTPSPPIAPLGPDYPEPSIDDECPTGSAVVGYDVATTSDPRLDVVDRIRTICGAVRLSHAGGVLSVEIGATTALPERGSGPGTIVPLRCPKNQLVVGYRGRSGAFVDQLGLRCAPLLVASTQAELALGAVTELGPVGGDGGDVHPATDCGPAQVVVGTRTLADFVLERLSLSCASVSLR
jgi:hypothetical protein